MKLGHLKGCRIVSVSRRRATICRCCDLVQTVLHAGPTSSKRTASTLPCQPGRNSYCAVRPLGCRLRISRGQKTADILKDALLDLWVIISLRPYSIV